MGENKPKITMDESKNQMSAEQSYKHTDVFLTHTWRRDNQGRDNHARVDIINRELNRRGITTWFDSQRMEGKIRDKMEEGVDFTSCVVVCVTEQYMQKINCGDMADNCLFEFQRALDQKTARSMLCVVMEKSLCNPDTWFGKLKDDMGSSLFVCMDGDLTDDRYLKRKINELVKDLEKKDITPSQIRKRCPNCVVTLRNKHQYQFYTEGKFCTYCSTVLEETSLPKNYCPECNTHHDGNYCSTCRGDLLDENAKLIDLEEQYVQRVMLTNKIDMDKYPIIASDYDHKIKGLHNEVQRLKTVRDSAQQKGSRLQLNDEGFQSKIQLLQGHVDRLTQNSSDIPNSAEQCAKLEPAFDAELQELEGQMRVISNQKKDITRQSNTLQQAVNSCLDEWMVIDKQMSELRSEAFDAEQLNAELAKDAPGYLKTLVIENKVKDLDLALRVKKELWDLQDNGCSLVVSLVVHDGSLEMERWMLNLELDGYDHIMQEIKMTILPDYLVKLISENKTNDIEALVQAHKYVTELKDGNGFNLLLSFTARYGNVEMLETLLRIGVRGVGQLNKKKETILHQGCPPDIIQYLCEHKYEHLLLQRSIDNVTPLMKYYRDNVSTVTQDGEIQFQDEDMPTLNLFRRYVRNAEREIEEVRKQIVDGLTQQN